MTAGAGRAVMAGVIAKGRPVMIDPFPLRFGRRIIGSHGGSIQPDRDIPRAARLCRQSALKLEEQITHRLPLEQVNAAIELVKAGQAGRCALLMDEESR